MTISQLFSLLTAKAHNFNFWPFIPYVLCKQHPKLSPTLLSGSSFYHSHGENVVCFHSRNAISAQKFMLVLEISRRFGAIPAQYCTSICRTLQVLLVGMSVIMNSKHYLFQKLLFWFSVPFSSSLPPFYLWLIIPLRLSSTLLLQHVLDLILCTQYLNYFNLYIPANVYILQNFLTFNVSSQ